MSAPICAGCVSGVIHSGTPKGRVSTIHGLKTYVTEPPDGSPPKGLIVMISDAFGWELPNIRVLADVYAEKGGFLVYVPDFMNGYSVKPEVMLLMDKLKQPISFSNLFTKVAVSVQVAIRFIPFVLHMSVSAVLPRITTFLRSVRKNEGRALGVGLAGFCYGGHFAVLVAHNDKQTSTEDGKPLADVVFTGHPSQVKIPVEFEEVRLPLSIAVGSKDFWLPFQKVGEVRKILDEKVEAEHEVVVYTGAKHGFTVRGDPGNEEEVKQGVEAEDQAVAWFKRFLGQA
ncbi:hypothetical protein GP486_003171 [Trichoglossum hirsutum]|uniref:Dienelactone hydrolase domain-containing protein n=1 Tax=Trichoglossum hirsutum TaxID=265104 RepID=A0A9P8LDL4_9PEZI|nr:hypothetical protein GP486_003171 [Trichoglossum hirsutum]